LLVQLYVLAANDDQLLLEVLTFFLIFFRLGLFKLAEVDGSSLVSAGFGVARGDEIVVAVDFGLNEGQFIVGSDWVVFAKTVEV
jgi:hypothetical protein